MDKDITFRPLHEELKILKLYLSIEKKRFEEKLQIQYDIAKEAGKINVLCFLLHPLIENAIKYGMKSGELPLKILIRAFLNEAFLVIEICNSGKWIDWGEAEGYHGTGTGLDNVQKRLKNAYPDHHRFEIIKSENKVCIKIEIQTDEQTGG
jgi:LytS/YehU family sensor histidine kinase